MMKRGLQKGDVFALHVPNCIEYPILLYGVSLVGGIVTTLNPQFTEEELKFQLQNSRTKYIITLPSLAGKIARIAPTVGIREVFVLGSAPGCTPFAALLSDNGRTRGFKVNPKKDVFCLPYSSGTTGLPKGVMLTHYNLVAHIFMLDSLRKLLPESPNQLVALVFMPFYHIAMLSGALGFTLFQGNKVVTMAKFDGELLLQSAQKFKVRTAYGAYMYSTQGYFGVIGNRSLYSQKHCKMSRTNKLKQNIDLHLIFLIQSNSNGKLILLPKTTSKSHLNWSFLTV